MIEAALSEYVDNRRNPEFHSPLVMSGWYSLFPDDLGGMETVLQWPAKFPNSDKPGVYLIFDAKPSLLYIGMTTKDLNSRLGCYFGYVSGRGSGCKIKNMQPPWQGRPSLVRTIAVQDSREACVLENFLINALKPPENSK